MPIYKTANSQQVLIPNYDYQPVPSNNNSSNHEIYQDSFHLICSTNGACQEVTPPEIKKLNIIEGSTKYNPQNNRWTAKLATESVIQGITISEGTVVNFYGNGKLESFFVTEKIVINGLELTSLISFHENGNLKSAVMAESFEMDGVNLEKGDLVAFAKDGKLFFIKHGLDDIIHVRAVRISQFKDGKIVEETLPANFPINNIIFSPDSSIYLGETGEFEYACLSKETDIWGIKCAKHSTVTFHTNGRIASAVLASDQTIQGIKCAGGKSIGFTEDGRLWVVKLSEDQIINGVKCAKDEIVKFYENGKLKNCTAAEKTEVQDMPVNMGQELEFSDDGKIIK